MDRLKEFSSQLVNNVRDAFSSFQTESPEEKDNYKPVFRIRLVTGDKRGAGTDANVYIVLYDSSGRCSKTLRPGCFLRNDHERGDTTILDVGADVGVTPPLIKIEIWRGNFGAINLGSKLNSIFFGGEQRNAADWFLDRVEVSLLKTESDEQDESGDCKEFLTEDEENHWVFPVHRWIEGRKRYSIPLYDAYLPQKDSRTDFRRQELEVKCKTYMYARKVPLGPVQVAELPSDENFSENFFWTFVQKKAALKGITTWTKWTKCPAKTFESLNDIYQQCLPLPLASSHWKEDWWFGNQRLQGPDPTIITLCKEIPLSFEGVDLSDVFGGGQTLQSEIQKRKIFLCDLSILEELPCKNNLEVAAPIALFHLNDNNELLPVAIQLRRGSSNNPIYTPLDDANTWLMAKMFYNNAEAQHHQSLTHLGLTHLLMEGICASVHRCLSSSHPLFRLMAPHFLYLIAINKRGEEKLINPGGWVDSTMTQAVEGMVELIGRGFQRWNFTKLNPVKEIQQRGLLDPDILQCYPYRDDIIDTYDAIHKYASTIIKNYYNSDQDLTLDWELRKWRQELSMEPPNGLGLKGVPGHNLNGFQTVEQLTEVITNIISTCTLGHAAANSQQYEQYAFVPNYPGILSQNPPEEKRIFTDEELFSLFPSRDVMMDIIVITNLLSAPITNQLAYFEVQYLFHPKDVEALQMFREDLKKATHKIKLRNDCRRIPYTDLDPDNLPNSISI